MAELPPMLIATPTYDGCGFPEAVSARPDNRDWGLFKPLGRTGLARYWECQAGAPKGHERLGR